ncbi:MAG: SDR family NAD(P)-dependent oxidoreductase [Candidatus Hydrogenedens sp.]|nr:SDR family NAD(P)-dependent oxidoreductase [Candidatus Hydrogenedens sp.]
MIYRDSVCLLTGCASGIGRHMANVLHARGAKLMLTDLDIERLDAQVAEARWKPEQVQTRRLDVRDPAAWETVVAETVDTFGGLDLCLNIAGVTTGRFIRDADPKLIDFIMDINAKGMMYGTHFAARHMAEQGSGVIVNIASAAGLIPVPGMSLYSASKFAIRGFSMACAFELEKHGVHVSCVCPDAVATPMLDAESFEPESMLSFGGNKILTVEEVERAIIDDAIGKRKKEVILPYSMNFLARFCTAFPSVMGKITPYFEKKAQQKQERFRQQAEARGAKYPGGPKV